jgi:transposase
MLNKRRDVENGVRALLREAGLKVGTPSRKDFSARVRELAGDDRVLAALSESLLAVIETMNQEVERLTKRVFDEVKVEPVPAVDDGARCRPTHSFDVPRHH